MTGWSWEYIENNVTFPMLFSFMKFWKVFPAEHVLLAALAQYKAPAKRKNTKAELADELSGIQGGTVRVKK